MSTEPNFRMIGGTPFNCGKCGKATSQKGLCSTGELQKELKEAVEGAIGTVYELIGTIQGLTLALARAAAQKLDDLSDDRFQPASSVSDEPEQAGQSSGETIFEVDEHSGKKEPPADTTHVLQNARPRHSNTVIAALYLASKLPTCQGCPDENHEIVIMAMDALKILNEMGWPGTNSVRAGTERRTAKP